MSVSIEFRDRTQVARQADILATANHFTTLKRVTGTEYAGPCPRCGGTDRFAVNTAKQVWNCRGCGRGGTVIELVRHVNGITFPEAVAWLTGESEATPEPRQPQPKPHERQHTTSPLWPRRAPFAGSIAEAYLRQARGYQGPSPATMGFLAPSGSYHPALIAAFAMPIESEPGVLAAPRNVTAVHLIKLRPDGSGKADIPKEEQKITVGSPRGLPLVISPVNDGLGLAICEGVEDALSVYEATGLGVWASGGASFMPKIANAVPSYVECVTVFAHDDAGKPYAIELARTLADRRIEVLLEGVA